MGERFDHCKPDIVYRFKSRKYIHANLKGVASILGGVPTFLRADSMMLAQLSNPCGNVFYHGTMSWERQSHWNGFDLVERRKIIFQRIRIEQGPQRNVWRDFHQNHISA